MLFLNRKNRKSKKPTKVELFESLDDIWLFNWDKLHETNDLKWLIKNENERNEYVNPQRSDARFLELMDEWFVLTDQSSNRKELFSLMKKLIGARNKVINGDEFQKLWVRKYEQMIKDLVSDNEGGNPVKERMALSMHTKMHIDPKKITVTEYFSLIEVVNESQPKTPIDHGE
jgi:hypothetical protein